MASGEAGDAGSGTIVGLGATLRATRKRLGLSVQTLAQRSGVSFGLVSGLERGLGNPSLQAVQRLAAALGLPVAQLLEPPADTLVVVPADRPYVLAPASDTPREGQAVRELLSPRGESAMQLIRSTLPPGFTNEARPFHHLGTETVTVLTGRLVVVRGDRRVELDVGDTATYGCSTPHWWANADPGETVVIGAVTPYER